MAGCGEDEPSGSDASGTDQASATGTPPVFPTGSPTDAPGTGTGTGTEGSDDAGATCELLAPEDLEQVAGLSGAVGEPDGDLCAYTVDGETVFRISESTYPQAAGAAQVLEATVSSFDGVEEVSDVGDAAAYVADAGPGPSLFVVVEDGQAATVLTLAFDPDTVDVDAPESQDQLVELGGLAAENL